jgi:CDP-glucose 4,6-dehydratase
MNRNFWRAKRVFLTGHTGFKGGWLAHWLADAGARVFGYALTPPTEPSLFSVCALRERMTEHVIADIRDLAKLQEALHSAQPEIVLHLAAQSLVHESYVHPIDTYAVNVLGTANVLEAIRRVPGVKVVVSVTSDKCYENLEAAAPFREDDPLGGADPYSSSKGCAEIVTTAYRRSFLAAQGVRVASARAGNVIGGGDWAKDRLVPDFFRAVDAHTSLMVRSPGATRPWQHVLEPLAGYLMLAERLHTDGEVFAQAWNFGPDARDIRGVRDVVETLCRLEPAGRWDTDKRAQVAEAHTLSLDSGKARLKLGWHPRWDLTTALEKTVEWHSAWRRDADMSDFTLGQIRAYEASAGAEGQR